MVELYNFVRTCKYDSMLARNSAASYSMYTDLIHAEFVMLAVTSIDILFLYLASFVHLVGKQDSSTARRVEFFSMMLFDDLDIEILLKDRRDSLL